MAKMKNWANGSLRKNSNWRRHRRSNSCQIISSTQGAGIRLRRWQRPYDYAVQIGTALSNTLMGSNNRDYRRGLAGADSLAGHEETDNLFGDYWRG